MSEITVSRPQPQIAVVTIDRPARRNACDRATWRDLAGSFRALVAAREVRLVVLTGAGGHFCAGADISEFARRALTQSRWGRNLLYRMATAAAFRRGGRPRR